METKPSVNIVIRVTFITLLILTLAAFAVAPADLPARAASGNNYQVFLPMISRPITFKQAPKPLNMPVLLDLSRSSSSTPAATELGSNIPVLELDQARSVQATLPISGGILTATAADGAVFTLIIPKDALMAETSIQMIPVASINGFKLGSSNGAAVQFEPDGLQFYRPVTLVIQPSVPIPVGQELTLSWHGDGIEFHRYPLELDHPYPEVVFSLMHFSGDGYISEVAPIPVKDDFPIPSNPEDQYKQAVEEMVRREREALANGQEGDPNFHKNMIDLLRYYYYEIVRPMMIAGETDCDFAKRVSVSKSMGWARQAELLRSGDELEQEVTEVKESYKKALSNCWKVSTEPCLNRNDVSRMQEALWVAREGQLMGLDFNINDVPECTCRSFWSYSAWELSFSMTYSRQAQAALEKNLGWANVSIDRRQTGTFILKNKKCCSPFPGWDNGPGTPTPPTGSATVNDSATKYYNDGKTYNYSTSASQIVDGYAYLTFDELACIYDLKLDVVVHGTDSSPQYPDKEINLAVIEFLALDNDAYADPQFPILRGEGDYDADTGAYSREGMYVNHGSAAGVLYQLFGNNVGYGHASWTLTPIP